MTDDEENLIEQHNHDGKSKIKEGVKINDKITNFNSHYCDTKVQGEKKSVSISLGPLPNVYNKLVLGLGTSQEGLRP